MRLSNNSAIDQLNNLCARLNGGGKIKCYSGSVPTNVDLPLGTGVTLLGTLTFSATAFGTATDDDPGAIAEANAITPDTNADAAGEISFVRLTESDDTIVAQLTAGDLGTEEVVFTDATVTLGGTITLNELFLTQPES